MNDKPQFHHLPPLLGSSSKYLQTIDNILDALVQQKLDQRSSLLNWLVKTYEVAETSAIAYMQCLARLGLIAFKRSGRIFLTELGRNYTEADLLQKCVFVADILFIRAVGCLEILHVFAKYEEPLHLKTVIQRLTPNFPYWRSRSPYEHRILWLLSLGCLVQTDPREYEITEFGRRQLARHAGITSIPHNLLLESLIKELDSTSMDTEHPSRFEHALADAFRFLGYEVSEMGTSGDTDLIVSALAGSDSYAAIIDAKTRGDGRLRDLSAYALREHQQHHGVEYIMVIARGFSEGRVLRQAMEAGITLVTVPTILQWLQLHAETLLNLTEYRELFAASGVVSDLPKAVFDASAAKQDLTKLLSQVVALMHETASQGLQQPLSSEQWFAMLVTKLHGVHYSAEEVSEALVFLAHPLVGAAICDTKGYVLSMTQASLSLTLKKLADRFDLHIAYIAKT